MAVENAYPVISCGHCGNKAPMKPEAAVSRDVSIGDPLYEETIAVFWELMVCPVCHQPILRETDADSRHMEDEGWHTIYPPRIGQRHELPVGIRRAYEAALKVRHVEPNAFAVLVGRVLEFICKDRGARGETLNAMLSDLSTRGAIPALLGEVAQQIRAVRNCGAHADEAEVRQEDVPVLIDLTESLLDHLYTIPARLNAMKQRIDARQS